MSRVSGSVNPRALAYVSQSGRRDDILLRWPSEHSLSSRSLSMPTRLTSWSRVMAGYSIDFSEPEWK